MSSSAGNVTPGGPVSLQGPDLPMDERTTDLQAWRAANEAKAARRRGFLLGQVASRPTPPGPAPVLDEERADEEAAPKVQEQVQAAPEAALSAPGQAAPPGEVPESAHSPEADPLIEYLGYDPALPYLGYDPALTKKEDDAWPVTEAPTAQGAGTPSASTSSSASSSTSKVPSSRSAAASHRSTTAAATDTAPPPRAPRRAPRSRLDVKAVCEAYVSGMSPPQIAKRFGCEPATVRRALRGAGVRLRDDRATYSGSQPFENTPEQVEHVVAAYASGLSIIATGKRVGIAAKRVRRILQEQGVQIRPAAHARAARSEPVPEPEAPQAQAPAPAPAAAVEIRNNWFEGPAEPVVVDPPARATPSLADELVALANDLAAFVGRIRRVAALAEEATS